MRGSGHHFRKPTCTRAFLRARVVVAVLAALLAAPSLGAHAASMSKNAALQNAQKEAAAQQREAERQRREAERQRREAERQRRIAEREAQRQQKQMEKQQRQQSAKSTAQNRAADKGDRREDQSSSKKNADDNAGDSKAEDKSADDTSKDENSETATPQDVGEDLSTPPPTMEKLFKRWLAPAQQQELANQRREEMRRKLEAQKENRALKAWSTRTKEAPDNAAARPVPAVSSVRPDSPKNAAAKASKTQNSTQDDTTEPSAQTLPTTRVAPVGRPPPLELGMPPQPELLAIDASPETITRARNLGFQIGHSAKLSKLKFSVTRLVVPKGLSTAQAKQLLAQKFPEISIEPNQKYRIYKTATGIEEAATAKPGIGNGAQPPSCMQDQCFASKLIGWKPALNSCANGAKIGIIDTSVDLTHPAFVRTKLTVTHFGPSKPPAPDWHGTGVTAILAGNAKSATPGLVPGANFYLADVFHADDDGQPASDTVSMLRAFDWLESQGVKIINMSLSGPRDELVSRAIQKLAAKGIVLVAAAGNEGPSAAPSYPAAYDGVIAVTAVNKNLRGYRYANRGDYIDVAAPGVGIWTALPGARQGFHSGTSFATPYITAILATVMARSSSTIPSDLLRRLDVQDLGDPGPDPIYGKGLVLAPQACGGGAVAQARISETGSTQRASGFSRASAGQGREVLPWLGLHD